MFEYLRNEITIDIALYNYPTYSSPFAMPTLLLHFRTHKHVGHEGHYLAGRLPTGKIITTRASESGVLDNSNTILFRLKSVKLY